MADNRARYEEALRRGHSYSWDQRWSEAVLEFEKAVGEAEQEPAPYAGLGMAYLELGDLKKALENYKLAARYSGGDMIYLKHVADVQERLGQLRQAGQTYMALGEIQLRRKKLDDAVGNWLRAVRLEPNLIGGHQRLATVYQRQGLTSNAIREYLAIARIYYSRGEQHKALRICEAALRLDPRNADVLTAIELIQHGAELPEEAEAEAPPSAEALGLASSEAVQRMASALEAERISWQPAYVEEEDHSPVQQAQRLAQQQLAAEIFEEDEEEATPLGFAGQLTKLERDALISQALDFQTRNRLDEAISCYERAMKGGVNSSAAHFSLGILYQSKTRFREAVRAFETSLSNEDFRLASHIALGQSYRALGSNPKTVHHFVTALKLVDLGTVDADQRQRVAELYDRLMTDLMESTEPDKVSGFVNAAVEFLSQRDWEAKVQAARNRLNLLSSGGRIMIIGDILTAGSAQVLESLYLSQEYAKHGKYNTALEEAYRAIQLSPFYLPAHLQVAELMAQQDRTEIAVSKYVNIANTYRVRGDVNGAITTFERALELSPLDLSTRMQLIDLLRQTGNVNRAMEHYVNIGEAYYNLAQLENARRAYLEALRLAAKGSAGQQWRILLLRRIADIDLQRLDWKRALTAYSELHVLDPGDEDVALNLVDLYFKVGRPKNALAQLDQFLTHLVRSGQGARVPAVLENLVEQWPAQPGLVDRLARLYTRQNRTEDAVKVLDQLGEAQLDAGDTRQAARTIERIIAMEPTDVTRYRQLLAQLNRDTV